MGFNSGFKGLKYVCFIFYLFLCDVGSKKKSQNFRKLLSMYPVWLSCDLLNTQQHIMQRARAKMESLSLLVVKTQIHNKVWLPYFWARTWIKKKKLCPCLHSAIGWYKGIRFVFRSAVFFSSTIMYMKITQRYLVFKRYRFPWINSQTMQDTYMLE